MFRAIGSFVYKCFRTIIAIWLWPILGDLDEIWDTKLRELVKSNKNVVVCFTTREGTLANSKGLPKSILRTQIPSAFVHEMSLIAARRLFQSERIPKDEQSLAFIKKGRPLLYCESPIVQPQQLALAKEYFEGKDDRKAAKTLGFSYVYVSDLVDLQ